MNAHTAETLIRCYRPGKPADGRTQKAVKFAEQDPELQKKLSEQEDKMAAKLAERAEAYSYRTKMLERKLDELSKKQEDQLAWLNLIDQRLADLPENKNSRTERLWFENQQMDAAKRLLRMNKQMVKLGYDVEVLRAVVEVGQRYFGRLKK